MWAALDAAVYSGLAAAWYFKWYADFDTRTTGISYRPRPIEYDYRVDVLYNRRVNATGSGDGDVRTDFGGISPGTPRHPAYPSGHSTYSAAASEVLAYFFPEFADQLYMMADNIGLARLWAGIHWRSDHTFGQQVGRAVGRWIIKQLQDSCIPPDVPFTQEASNMPPPLAQPAAEGMTPAVPCSPAPDPANPRPDLKTSADKLIDCRFPAPPSIKTVPCRHASLLAAAGAAGNRVGPHPVSPESARTSNQGTR